MASFTIHFAGPCYPDPKPVVVKSRRAARRRCARFIGVKEGEAPGFRTILCPVQETFLRNGIAVSFRRTAGEG